MPKEVTRHIQESVSNTLWGRAAGRCEFDGCNLPLWKSPVTQEAVNIAERAHIWSFADSGPRGNAGIDPSDLNAVENLILVCHACHRKIDRDSDGGRYSVELLRLWKRRHESRVELATSICPEKTSHVVTYGANIGAHSSPVSFSAVSPALFPTRYPAEDRAIQLGMINSANDDRSPAFWREELRNLQILFDRRVRPRLAEGDVRHISVFGLAPQPLLTALGVLLTDIVPADVFQLRREPTGWGFDDSEVAADFTTVAPTNLDGPPALVFSISASIVPERITNVLGPNASIWSIGVPAPHNDVLRSRAQLAAFRKIVRAVLDRVKREHGQDTVVHIFPAMPVSTAVELGRVRAPKADAPWRIYDQLGERGFVPVLDVSGTGMAACGENP